MPSTNGRRTAIRPRPTSSSKGSFLSAVLTASSMGSTTRRRRPGFMRRRSISSCRAGASGYAMTSLARPRKPAHSPTARSTAGELRRGAAARTIKDFCNTSSASARMAPTATRVLAMITREKLIAMLGLGFIAFFAAERAHAELNVFACEPEWSALVSEIGGNKVSVFTATTAKQDPHQVQARPALIAQLRSADLVVCTGAELEIGWMPVLLRQAANGRVQPGSHGYFEAAQQVRLLDVPTRVDRAEGDIHPAGNPHIQTDPRNIATVAAALTRRMGELDQADAATFAAQAQNFAGRWTVAMQRWTQRAAPFRGTTVAAYHKSWTYLEDWLGLREAATIEPKPGIPPGSQYLAQLVADLPAKKVRAILYSAYEDPRGSEFVAQRIGATAVMLPFTVGGTDRAKDLFGLFDDTIDRLSGPLAGAAVGKR